MLRQTFDWSRIEPDARGLRLRLLRRLHARHGGSRRAGAADPVQPAAPLPCSPAPLGTTCPPRSNASLAAFAQAVVRRYGSSGSLWSEHPEVTKRHWSRTRSGTSRCSPVLVQEAERGPVREDAQDGRRRDQAAPARRRDRHGRASAEQAERRHRVPQVHPSALPGGWQERLRHHGDQLIRPGARSAGAPW